MSLIIKIDNSTKDVESEYGIYTKHVPFNIFPKLKEPYKNSWHDENGDDEFLPPFPLALRYEAYEMKIDFVYKGSPNTANSQIRAFISFLQGGFLKIYDGYSGIGRQKVRYISMDDDATLYRREIDVVEFSLNFKVNDPLTQITL